MTAQRINYQKKDRKPECQNMKHGKASSPTALTRVRGDGGPGTQLRTGNGSRARVPLGVAESPLPILYAGAGNGGGDLRQAGKGGSQECFWN